MSVKITREETNLEILARIAKAAARKYDCTLAIDFHNGNRRIAFYGDRDAQQKIADTVEGYFRRSPEDNHGEAPTPPPKSADSARPHGCRLKRLR